ncbi:hypothetical protein [Salinicola rhizosphaerae]|uniref:Oligosaccharide repeat unit polymerase n=1 Tax=Salinicola rhizosphaerae TaxID=1443141 RepID=A0ABQ3DQ28_9GAMM|nr:hypothetical protein [Salinicola rhizosphaerae]GHB09894.1 hypothetical protein GCM10009038_04440 [Salinicola rhizosphaerae]
MLVINAKRLFVALVATFAVALPKSGVAIGGIPLNTIYLLIALSFPILLLKAMLSQGKLVRQDRYSIYVWMLVPFWLLFLTITLINGPGSVGVYFGYIMALIMVPIFFYLWSKRLGPQEIQYLLRCLKNAIRFAVGFGLFLFVFKIGTGQYFSIPMLTTTFGAELTLEAKMNDRGGLYKLFSTYNNGNIYAVCMIMLLPVYTVIEKRRYWVILAMLSIMLTLSRTAWALLMVYCVFEYLIFNRAISVKRLILICAALCLVVPGIIGLLGIMGQDVTFLFDSNLGGRAAYLSYFFDAGLISTSPLTWSYEIPYVSFAEFVGLISLIPFLMFFSNVISARSLFDVSRPVSRSASIGCVMYWVATFSDAALVLVPTFVIYSLLVMLSFSE